MTWNELYMVLHERIMADKNFGEETATVYCAGNGEYFPVDAACKAGDTDVVDPESLVIVIQN
jgi:hypothetical protein